MVCLVTSALKPRGVPAQRRVSYHPFDDDQAKQVWRFYGARAPARCMPRCPRERFSSRLSSHAGQNRTALAPTPSTLTVSGAIECLPLGGHLIFFAVRVNYIFEQ